MKYRIDKLNESIGFWDMWEDGTWEPKTKETIETLVNNGTFVDIGAWIGPTVLWAAPYAGRVVAIEPDPIAFEMLQDNVSDLDNVELYNVAVCDYNGKVNIQTQGDSMSRTGAGEHEVDCYTLKTLFEKLNITEADLIKMDIEGAEREVLTEGEPFLYEFGSPLLLSYHAWAPWDKELMPNWKKNILEEDEWLMTQKGIK